MEQHDPPLELEAGPPPSHAPSSGAKRRGHGWIWFAVLVLLILGGIWLWKRHEAAVAASKKTGPPPAIPVVATKAIKGDIGVYFTGLGAVTPLNTITVKSRVDGELTHVLYKEGDLVQEGGLLVEIDPRPFEVLLTQAEGQLLKDQATLENARVDLARYETLLTQKAVPEQQLATQRALVKQEEGIVKTDEGVVAGAKLNIVYCHINAPLAGRVGLRLVDSGNQVHASDTNGLLVITQVQPISVIFTIAEDQLAEVVKRMHAGQQLGVDAYDREMKTKIATGTLTTIDNQIDPTTGTLKLRAVFPNKDNALFANQFVNARLLVQEKKGVTLLPTAAVQLNAQSTYVYVVKQDSTLELRQVKVGTTEGDQSEIVSGLNPDEVVVMTGVDKLQAGSKVTVHFPGEKPPPDKPTDKPAAAATGRKGAKK